MDNEMTVDLNDVEPLFVGMENHLLITLLALFSTRRRSYRPLIDTQCS